MTKEWYLSVRSFRLGLVIHDEEGIRELEWAL